MELKTFVFFGITGSGKGTQVRLLMDYLASKGESDIVYIYPGDEYRKLITIEDNLTAEIVKDYVPVGRLVPGFLTDAIATSIMVNSLKKNSVLITDGYPRAVQQSKNFEEMMSFYSRKNIQIVYIEISEQEAERRMRARARHDDTDEGIAKRFEAYMAHVIPSLNYFKDKEGFKIHTINGEQDPANVHEDIVASLGI